MRRLFVLLVCAQFILSGVLMVFPHRLSANPTPVNLPQASAAEVAFSLIETENHGKADRHSAEPLLADVTLELPELANSVSVGVFEGRLPAAYDRVSQAGPLRPVIEGPRRPPRSSGVFLRTLARNNPSLHHH